MREVRGQALDWLAEAEADLRHARQAFRFRSYNWACFAAEQAAEKAIKAFLMGVLKKRPIHTHDLTALHRETRGMLRLPTAISTRLAQLSAYYTGARYPNSGLNRPSISITATDARSAIEIAKGVVTVVKRQVAGRG